MEASAFHHHPFLLDQFLAFSDPYEQVLPTPSIEEASTQASTNGNNLQILDSSSLSSIEVHDHQSEMKKMPTTDRFFGCAQSKIMAKTSGKRHRKQKKSINGDQEKKKKMMDSKEEGGYIHVRARRGEATDSHSLAERVRREKISEKMKALQSIVPGCDKITGKALMLDEVINYVHSLQNEIQILSLKLACVNPSMLYDYGAGYEECMLKPHDQQQQVSFQEHQMPCMNSQNCEEALWDLGEQRQELDDLYAIINCNSFC